MASLEVCRMSEPARVGLVGEGRTERVLIEAALRSIFSDRTFIVRQLQPEESLPFGAVGTGWVGGRGGAGKRCQARAGGLRNGWPRLATSLDEAERFDREVRAAIVLQ